ncbi:hypothetical protein ACFFJY_01630 [Fictibacillus aquaticus]|uniref:Sporulation protein n=1 Tax=Fictibacillus aquaticus TaxID=2021314 RepID=A0A235F7X9_9BACL|nr:hypothetical protein [Fictibacillus aquaticus]OYD57416.1 hypothetical protein CGZ90_12100 [Fictibacillus aquaticus]
MRKWIFSLSAVVLLGACSSPVKPPEALQNKTEPAAYESKKEFRDNLFGHGIVNYHLTKNEPHINYSTDTNMNPHDYRTMNTTRFDISDDQDNIRSVVKTQTGIEPQMVSINGNYAHIHVNVPSDTSKKERGQIRRKVMNAVKIAVPRYNYSLKID